MTNKTNLIKHKNLQTLRQAMRSKSAFTKPQLSQLTNLSVVTINALIKSLEELGEVSATSVQTSEGGRPATCYGYNLQSKLALAVFILEVDEVDTAHFKVIDLLGDVVASRSLAMPELELASFDEPIQTFIETYPNIEAICFGIPGGEVEGQMVISDYPLLRGKSLSGHIKDKFNIPVLVENDVNVAVLGYCKRMAVSVEDSVSAIYFPEKYPPGAGHFLNGSVFKGYKGLAGEIKDLPIDVDWEGQLSEEAFQMAVVKLIQSFAYMLNPTHLVLYGRRLKPEMIQPLDQWFKGPLAQAIMPACQIETVFHTDFETGLVKLALNMIDYDFG